MDCLYIDVTERTREYTKLERVCYSIGTMARVAIVHFLLLCFYCNYVNVAINLIYISCQGCCKSSAALSNFVSYEQIK